MSDLLEPFRRAAELGCPDFLNATGAYLRGTEPCTCFELPLQVITGYDESVSRRINRYAAAVCAEWWNQEKHRRDHDRLSSWHQRTVGENMALYDAVEQCDDMIDLCRAFGRKYGGTQ